MPRESGYYWVKYKGEWTIGKYDKDTSSYPWQIVSSISFFNGIVFEEIGSKIDFLGAK